MAKKATHLDKDSKFPYAGDTIYFATKHGKEAVVAPLFAVFSTHIEAVPVDTDAFGTFSGEVERKGTIRETLRQKIAIAEKLKPEGRIFLASEGSFGPHPMYGIGQTDLESLLLVDRKREIEIYAEHLDERPVHAEQVVSPSDQAEISAFLREISFPEQRVMVHPEGSVQPVEKGLNTLEQVSRAIAACAAASSTGRAVVATDLRAHFSPNRMRAIGKAAQALLAKLQSPCPKCALPGFAITQGVPGLPCEACGQPSGAAKEVLWECVGCFHYEQRPRPDGKTYITSSECELCNP